MWHAAGRISVGTCLQCAGIRIQGKRASCPCVVCELACYRVVFYKKSIGAAVFSKKAYTYPTGI